MVKQLFMLMYIAIYDANIFISLFLWYYKTLGLFSWVFYLCHFIFLFWKTLSKSKNNDHIYLNIQIFRCLYLIFFMVSNKLDVNFRSYRKWHESMCSITLLPQMWGLCPQKFHNMHSLILTLGYSKRIEFTQVMYAEHTRSLQLQLEGLI